MMHVVANGLGVRYDRVVTDGFRQWEALEGNASGNGALLA